ncbi:putative formate/nitrite transporter [Panaeolus papilionaceus]|nr:putative formate/nitrite transporter [Panaeolus papilionaceus]
MVDSTLKPQEVAQLMVQYSVNKHRDRYESLFMKAFMAGAMLSFGGLLSEILQGGAAGLTASNPGIVKVLGGFVFPVGLVISPGTGTADEQHYFPMACVKGAVPWWSLPVNWIIVTFGNLAGSLFFAAILVHYTGIVSTEPYETFIKNFAIHKAHDPHWHQIFLRGIGCNWLVSVAVWQAAGAKDTISKAGIFAIWIPIWIFVACGFDHVVANMFSVPLGIMFGAPLTVDQYIKKSLIAAYLGNIVGALIVALPAYYMYLREDTTNPFIRAEQGEGPGTPSSDSTHEVKTR